MSLTEDIIKERIGGDVAPDDLALAVGLISDAVPTGSGLAGINEAITKARAAYGPLFVRAPATVASPPPTTLTAKAKAEHQARQASSQQANSGEPNPFLPATRNLTQQAILLKKDPERAALLKAEAAR